MELTKSIGGKHMESQCKECGEVFMWTEGDDLFVYRDADGKTWPYCSICYDGPRVSREEIERRKSQ